MSKEFFAAAYAEETIKTDAEQIAKHWNEANDMLEAAVAEFGIDARPVADADAGYIETEDGIRLQRDMYGNWRVGIDYCPNCGKSYWSYAVGTAGEIGAVLIDPPIHDCNRPAPASDLERIKQSIDYNSDVIERQIAQLERIAQAIELHVSAH